MISAHPKSDLRVFRREEQHSSDDDLDLDDDVPTQSDPQRHSSTSSFHPNVFISHIDSELIRKIIIKRGNDKAPGVSGLTNDSLLGALTYSDFTNNLSLLFRKLVSKEFIPESWLTSRLVPIPKGEDSYRPIAVGEAFLTILSEPIRRTALPPTLIRQHVEQSQYGVGVPDGCLRHVITMRSIVANEPDIDIVLIDIKNAFNSIERVRVREALITFPSSSPEQ